LFATAEPSLGFLVTEALVLPELFAGMMSEQQRERFAHLLDGRARLAGAFSEPDAGSNPGEITTRATRVEGGYRIRGQKTWISGGHRSEAMVVSCRIDDPGAPDHGAIAPVLVERSVAPYTTREIELLGLRAHSVAEVWFDDVVVPSEARIGEGPGGLQAIGLILQKARCNMAVIATGIGQRAYDLALDYAQQRRQFGKQIAGFQLVQDMLVTMLTEVSIARQLSFRALTMLQEGQDAMIESSMAKAWCTEAAVRIASTAIQIHGGIGLTVECEASKLFRDARMMTIPDGTTQLQTLIIGRAITGVSALK
jgi:alkylation response protein AidB-like acyl-CoA dehydrogenase